MDAELQSPECSASAATRALETASLHFWIVSFIEELFVYSFNKYSLSLHRVSGSSQGSGHSGDQRDKLPDLKNLISMGGGAGRWVVVLIYKRRNKKIMIQVLQSINTG